MDFSARQAPGIVTVITRDEIINSGARDLIDVLRLVPGLDFGVDVESSLGLGVRGNWAYEGKILVLVDGQRYNESFFGSAQLERISPEQVERIEIVRGPGSAVYGGFAELGVIKITTRSAKAIAGTEAALSYGRMARTFGNRSANLAFGKVFENSELSAKARFSDSNRSDRRYTDFSGGSYSMKDASEIHSRNLNIGFKSGVADLRLIADQYRTTEQDYYAESILPRPMHRNYDAYFAEISREFSPGEKFTLTPSFNYSYQEPFNGFDADFYPRDKSSHYSKGTVIAAYTASDRLRFSGGAEVSNESGILADTTPRIWNTYDLYFRNGTKSIHYHNTAFFLEGVADYPFGMLSAGARCDKHEKFDRAFSPRLAWTKVFDRLHLKTIYSQSFRAPGIDNLEIGPDLKPEKTSVTEFEAGYKFGDDFFLSANIFHINIKDPIVYYTLNAAESYGNYGHTGSEGFEVTARVKKDWGYSDLAYSYYTAASNGVAFYNAGAGSDALLAFAPHKFTMNASVKLSPDFSVNPSAVYYAGRRGYYASNYPAVLTPPFTHYTRKFKDILLANLNFSRKNLLSGHMELGLGVFDIFNSGYSYLQPYNGGHAPLPGPTREVRARASYKF
ncbi:MAG: TonB-dependent receptor plug domain-containing protein [Elusimicrobiales bacterium]|nr:TonB-dependent receptor plug domain-containing protein [Elusimicrobiales bacterium]